MSRNTLQRALRLVQRRTGDLRNNVRQAATWRGQQPAVYLRPHPALMHSVWRTYQTDPPLRYAPAPLAKLCHAVNRLTSQDKKHVLELEHPFHLVGGEVEDWEHIWNDREIATQRMAHPNCETVFTFSRGLVEHFKHFLHPDVWSKLDFVYPAYPSQAEQGFVPERPFNILIVSSRWSDKGMPEAMQAFEILRARHGQKVRLTLVSQGVPSGFQLPQGVTHHDVPLMSQEFKAQMYREADVLFLPCYSETAACFVEAYAFGVPVVTTRIHHGDEFVREGQSGFLLHAPLYGYCDGFGTRWKSWSAFQADVVTMRERGELQSVVEESVDVLDAMICGNVDLNAMRHAAWDFHKERFSPRARNEKLLLIYGRALGEAARLDAQPFGESVHP